MAPPYKSVSLKHAPDDVRAWFEDNDLGPGDLVFILGAPKLTDAILVAEYEQQSASGLEHDEVCEAIADHYERTLAHIKRRVRLLQEAA